MKNIIKNISKKTINALIRNSNLIAKFTWVLEIIELPKFNSKHLASIKKLTDRRNSFVHYKWKSFENDIDYDYFLEFNDYDEILKAVKYIKTYSSKVELRGNKAVMKKALKKT